jgi:hypothetical protein
VKIGETKTIDQRETENMFDAWSEYLVLEKLKGGQFRLDQRRNEVFGEAFDYCQENDLIDDDGSLNVPNHIEGKDVYMSGSVIYGENLVQDWLDDPEVIFTTPERGSVVDWCKKHEWDCDRVIKSLVEECGDAKRSFKKKSSRKKSAKKKTSQEELLEPPSLGKSLSPEEAKMADLRYDLKKETYKKSSKEGKK